MSLVGRVADVVQRGMVVALVGAAGFHISQIASNVREGSQLNKVDESSKQYFKDVQQKVDDEMKNYGKIDKRDDWYEKEDDSYLKNTVKPKSRH